MSTELPKRTQVQLELARRGVHPTRLDAEDGTCDSTFREGHHPMTAFPTILDETEAAGRKAAHDYQTELQIEIGNACALYDAVIGYSVTRGLAQFRDNRGNAEPAEPSTVEISYIQLYAKRYVRETRDWVLTGKPPVDGLGLFNLLPEEDRNTLADEILEYHGETLAAE